MRCGLFPGPGQVEVGERGRKPVGRGRFRRAKKRLRHVNNNISEALCPISGTAMQSVVDYARPCYLEGIARCRSEAVKQCGLER